MCTDAKIPTDEVARFFRELDFPITKKTLLHAIQDGEIPEPSERHYYEYFWSKEDVENAARYVRRRFGKRANSRQCAERA